MFLCSYRLTHGCAKSAIKKRIKMSETKPFSYIPKSCISRCGLLQHFMSIFSVNQHLYFLPTHLVKPLALPRCLQQVCYPGNLHVLVLRWHMKQTSSKQQKLHTSQDSIYEFKGCFSLNLYCGDIRESM